MTKPSTEARQASAILGNAALLGPEAHGLYNPDYEKDSCGVGFICDIKGRPSNALSLIHI